MQGMNFHSYIDIKPVKCQGHLTEWLDLSVLWLLLL